MGLFAIVYPFLVYFGLEFLNHKYVALVFIFILILRFLFTKSSIAIPWLKPATVLGSLVLLSTILLDSVTGLLLYPVVINLTLFVVFAWSLYKKPSVIETMARIREPELDSHGIKYTEQVTLAWCIFFILNTVVSLYTVWLADMKIWTLYNGFIAYLLVGIIFLIELLIRTQVKKRHSNAP